MVEHATGTTQMPETRSRCKGAAARARRLVIGPGFTLIELLVVIEAGCKTLIGSRCRQSGMFWGKPGAENVLALRCIHSSRRLDQFRKERLNAQAARNDCLTLVE